MAAVRPGEGARTNAPLFDARFLESLEHLRIVARRVAPRGRFAEHRSRDAGGGIEFKDYRPYVAGDDLRAIDWNIYRRLGRLFVRLFEEMEDLPLYVLPDVSRSAWIESPPRAHAALRTTLALASISLGQHDRVGVFPFDSDLRVLSRPQTGKGRILALADRLSSIEPGAGTDVARALATLSGMRLRDGLVCVVSDFFDPAGVEAVVAALRRVRHKLLLVQLVRASDREPTLRGDLRLVDCETSAEADVSVTPEVVARYRQAYQRFEEHLASFARERNCGLARIDADREVVPQLAALFESGALVV